jgi:nucleoside-diphosphate-sugar epimerase
VALVVPRRSFKGYDDMGPSLDVRNAVDVSDAVKEADLVIHLAARKGSWFCAEDKTDTVDVNLLGTLRVIHACQMFARPLIHFGTTAYYMSGPEPRFYDETAETYPRTLYGMTKLTAEQQLAETHLRYLIVRPVYGYGNIDQFRASRSESWPDVILQQMREGRREPLVTDMGHEFVKDYCVAPETRILTSDLRWIEAGNLKVGDGLTSFEETASGPRARAFCYGEVTRTKRRFAHCLRVTLDDDTALTCTDEHRWLVRRNQRTAGNMGWVRTDELVPGDRLLRFVCPWKEDLSREAGYLAGAFDGEGCVGNYRYGSKSNFVQLGFAQKQNEMLVRVELALDERGYLYHKSVKDNGVQIRMLGGRNETMRFLGSVRPSRLLAKFSPDGLGTLRTADECKVVSIKDVGQREIVALATSTETYIAEGFGAHNTHIYDIVNATILLASRFMSGFIRSGEIVQVGAGGNYTFGELVETFNPEFPVIFDRDKDYKGHQAHTYEKLRKMVPGWRPKIDALDFAATQGAVAADLDVREMFTVEEARRLWL